FIVGGTKMNGIKRSHMPLYIIASFLFGLKTYIIYRFFFTIELANFMQEFILLINPFIAAFLFFALSIWFKTPSRQMKFIRYGALFGTIILYFNLVFYRSFTDFITIPQLFQLSNMTDLGSSVASLVKFYDVLFFADVAIIWFLSKRKLAEMSTNYLRRNRAFVLVITLILLDANFLLAEIERPQLFTRAFDREYLVKNIGIFYFHIYDVALHSKVKTQ